VSEIIIAQLTSINHAIDSNRRDNIRDCRNLGHDWERGRRYGKRRSESFGDIRAACTDAADLSVVDIGEGTNWKCVAIRNNKVSGNRVERGRLQIQGGDDR
jgi:hypothetical protein